MKIYKTYRGFKSSLANHELSNEMKEYFEKAEPLLKEMFRRKFKIRKGEDILSTVFEIINPLGEIISLPNNPDELKNLLIVRCPKCGAEMFHEIGQVGGILHYCPKCGYAQWGEITNGSCVECAI